VALNIINVAVGWLNFKDHSKFYFSAKNDKEVGRKIIFTTKKDSQMKLIIQLHFKIEALTSTSSFERKPFFLIRLLSPKAKNQKKINNPEAKEIIP
jgi:hypothetical protein